MADEAVAIVGMSVLLPEAPDLARYWQNLVGGVDAIREAPPDRWDPLFYAPSSHVEDPARFYCRRGGFVRDAHFDPIAFGIMPVAVDGAEPDQLIALHVAARALDDAGTSAARTARERVGVILGRGGYLGPGVARLNDRVRTAEQLAQCLRALLPELEPDRIEEIRRRFQASLGPARPESAIGLVPNLAASRIANRLDLHGPAYTVDAACASSLIAIDHAVRELQSGRCDLVLAGGVHHCHDLTLWSVFSQLGALSPSQEIRPFDRGADGLLIGEGTGVVALRRLADAERDGDRIYAVIRGVGVASDGRDSSLMTPRVAGQLLALERAWHAAQLDPTAIALLEAHGTGTPIGDAAELETLKRFFGAVEGERRAGLGSVKSMIGHAMPASGAAGLIKTALALYHGVKPPTLHCEDPQPQLRDTRFRALDKPEPFEPHEPRLAAVNAFGFGGINAHVVLEGHAVTPRRVGVFDSDRAAEPRTADLAERRASGGMERAASSVALRETGTVREHAPVVLGDAVVSNDEEQTSDSALVEPNVADQVWIFAARDTRELLSQVSYAAEHGAPPLPAAPGPVRLALADPTPKRIEMARRVVERGKSWRGRGDLWFSCEGLLNGSGRLAFLLPGVEPSFDPHVDDITAHFGIPRVELPTGDLEAQGFAIVELARLLDRALSELGVVPDLIAGHSVGEWSGMVVSRMIPELEADRFIASLERNRLVVPDVVYAALGCGVEAAERVLAGLDGVALSHDNCPHQSILCGRADAVRIARERLRANRVLSEELPFRSGFHSPFFAEHLTRYLPIVERTPLVRPRVPLWSATTCAPYPEDPAEIRALVARHFLERVRFRELTQVLYREQNVRVFLQVGLGSLPGFVTDTLRSEDHLAISTLAPGRGLAQLRRAAAALFVEGAQLDLDRLSPARSAARACANGERAASPRTNPAPAAPSLGDAARARPRSEGGVRLRLGAPLAAFEPMPIALHAMPTTPAHAVAPKAASAAVALDAARSSRDATTRSTPASPLLDELASVLREVDEASRVVAEAWTRSARANAVQRPAPPLTAQRASRSNAPAASRGSAAKTEAPVMRDDLSRARGETPNGVERETPGGLRAVAAKPAAVSGAPNVPSLQREKPLGGIGRAASGTAAGSRRLDDASSSGTNASVQEHRELRRFSLDTLPELADHCFYRQARGWPDASDRFPVAPMTAFVALMVGAAQRAAPQQRVVALESVRAARWLSAAPAVDVELRTQREAERVRVVLGEYARCTARLASTYTAPQHEQLEPLRDPRPSPVPIEGLYRDRWLFHGPRYQGVVELGPLADNGICGTLIALPALGALLDAAGQLLGFWVMMRTRVDRLALPTQIDRIELFGDEPAPGTRVHCEVRIRELSDVRVRADLDLCVDGRLWARIRGWEDRRFESDDLVWDVFQHTERSLLADPGERPYVLVRERWRTAASRELMMRRYLDAAERAQYATFTPNAQREWLLGRIAAKDAVRRWLWDHGHGPLFPAQIHTETSPQGTLRVSGPFEVDLRVAAAHAPGLGVALVAPGVDVAIELARSSDAPSRLIPCSPEIPIEVRSEGDCIVRWTAVDRIESAIHG